MRVEIRPLFETTLAAPAQAPGSPIRHEKGATMAINHRIETKSFGSLMFIGPLPTHLMLNEACRLAAEVMALAVEIKSSSRQQVFSKLNSDPTMTAERALREDPEAQLVHIVPTEKAYAYLQKIAAFHFHLIAAIEAFCNQMIPSDHKVPDPRNAPGVWAKLLALVGKNAERSMLDKAAIERFFSMEEKLSLVADLKGKADVKQKPCWKTFKETKRTRDDVVHLKNGGVAIAGYEPTYAKLFDADCEKAVRHIVELMNYLLPDFVKLVD